MPKHQRMREYFSFAYLCGFMSGMSVVAAVIFFKWNSWLFAWSSVALVVYFFAFGRYVARRWSINSRIFW